MLRIKYFWKLSNKNLLKMYLRYNKLVIVIYNLTILYNNKWIIVVNTIE